MKTTEEIVSWLETKIKENERTYKEFQTRIREKGFEPGTSVNCDAFVENFGLKLVQKFILEGK